QPLQYDMSKAKTPPQTRVAYSKELLQTNSSPQSHLRNQQSANRYEKLSRKSSYRITSFSISSKHSFEHTNNDIRLANEDHLILQKAMQYAMSSLKLACKTKNAISHVKESIQNLIQIITGTNNDNDNVTIPEIKYNKLHINS
ncbi:11908_t:CDS:2, partial [Racocetra persica]